MLQTPLCQQKVCFPVVRIPVPAGNHAAVKNREKVVSVRADMAEMNEGAGAGVPEGTPAAEGGDGEKI
jgi:hypothetical protein